MTKPFYHENQIHCVTGFHDLVSKPFSGSINAICWQRELVGDFAEIVGKIELSNNMVTVDEEDLLALNLSEQGQFAREIILNDLKVLKAHGASPVLNLIGNYERDFNVSFFPTDVYSWHVDRSPIPTDTFLCTYYGEASEILADSQAQKKVLIPEIRSELKKLYKGGNDSFESFLTENFFDLHYEAKPESIPVSLGRGNLWKLAVDHPESKVSPCIHRAPIEKPGENRLMLIC